MANLEIKLSLDGTNDEMVEVTGKLLSALAKTDVEFKAEASAPTSDELEKKIIQKEKAAKVAELKAKKAAEAKAKKEEEKASKEKEKEIEETEDSEDNDPVVTIEQIKSVMAKKISEHRDSIKKQMTKIGAQNVSTIPESAYNDFYSFLEELD